VSHLAIRRIGWSLIALLWVSAAYLIVHYAALGLLGPQRLHHMLGERVYNAIVPMGGFTVITVAAVALVVWLVPFCLALGAAWFLLGAVAKRSRRRRACVATSLAVAAIVALPFGMLDGWPWALMPLVWEDDTEFAPGYSPVGFWLVRDGMSPADVVARVGAPLQRYPLREPGVEGWRWTRSPHDSSYRERVVVFRDGRVAEKHSEFYV
jgi:hypothetical protein